MHIQAAAPEAYQLFHNGILALAKAERNGIRIDTRYCHKKKQQLDRMIIRQEKKFQETKLYKRWQHIHRNKTNIYSGLQLSRILYKHMKLEPPKLTTGGQGATDEISLSRLGIPDLDMLVKIRRLNKIKKTYLEAFMREETNGFMHPSFNLHTVRTYRSSSADPNFQNIPKRDEEAMEICRRAIIPRDGHLLMEADFSSLEVNISECYHRDPRMMEYLLDKKSDMHLDMARQIFMLPDMDRSQDVFNTLRNAAKNGFVFPQFYGDYYGNNVYGLLDWVKLSKTKWKKNQGLQLPDGKYISTHFMENGIKSFQDFIEHIRQVEDDFWNNRFKKYQQWKRKWINQYRRKGYLQMHTGFVCSGIMGNNEIINYPIQGTAFHCLLFTFIEMTKFMEQQNLKSKLVGQIHDSIVLDALPNEVELLENQLQHIVKTILPGAWKWIIVPLEIEIEKYGIDSAWVKV